MNLQRREEIRGLIAEITRYEELGATLDLESKARDAITELLAHIDTMEQAAAERVIADGSRGPTPDYTGEGSAWVPPVEARAVVVAELDEVESLRDTVRFLASVVSKGAQIRHQIIFSLHENKPDEAKGYAMMKWPIIQGMQNQIDLEKVGKQAYTPKRIRLAVDSLLGIRANQGGANE